MSFYAIWDNLYSFLVKVNQNLKFLHWAAIVIGNRPVSALLALLLQYLLNPSNHLRNLFWTNSARSFSNFPLQSIPHTSLALKSMRDISASNNFIVNFIFSLKWFPISFRNLECFKCNFLQLLPQDLAAAFLFLFSCSLLPITYYTKKLILNLRVFIVRSLPCH